MIFCSKFNDSSVLIMHLHCTKIVLLVFLLISISDGRKKIILLHQQKLRNNTHQVLDVRKDKEDQEDGVKDVADHACLR